MGKNGHNVKPAENLIDCQKSSLVSLNYGQGRGGGAPRQCLREWSLPGSPRANALPKLGRETGSHSCCFQVPRFFSWLPRHLAGKARCTIQCTQLCDWAPEKGILELSLLGIGHLWQAIKPSSQNTP